MSTVTRVQRVRRSFTVDRITVLLVAFTLVVQVGALATLSTINAPAGGTAAPAPSQTTDSTTALSLLALVVVESALLLGVWAVWQRLPGWLQTILKYTSYASIFATGLYLCARVGRLPQGIVAAGASGGLYVADRVLGWYDLDWITWNLVGLGLGVLVTTAVSLMLAPGVVVVLLVLLMAWDHTAVNLSGVMDRLVAISTDAGLPNYLILPVQYQVSDEAVTAYVASGGDDEKPPGLGGVIGVGDFALPGVLTGSAWIASAPVVAAGSLAGAVVGAAVLRNTLAGEERSLPALLWLNTGALLGFGLAGLAFGSDLVAILGV